MRPAGRNDGTDVIGVQRPLTFGAPDGTTLAGTLTSPGSGSWPAALILNGSGPLDRDSTMDGQALGFADALAADLAAAGLASLRIDKRGVAQSGGEYLSAGLDTEIGDASSALDAMIAAPEVDARRVALIGHSVGALISARLAAGTPDVGALVMLAGPASDGRTVLAWQGDRIASSLPGPRWLLPAVSRAMQRYSLRKAERSDTDTVRLPIKRHPAKWMRQFMDHDPAPDLRRVRCPVLAITGRKDLQVDADDVARIADLVGGSFVGETPDDLTHLLRREEGPAGMLSYPAQLKRPVDPELLQRVATWVADHLDVSPTADH